MDEPPPASAHDYTNAQLIRRLLGLAWVYRAGCVKILVCQVALLLLGVAGLGLIGLGFDVIAHHLVAGARGPRWPFGLAPPATWTPRAEIALIGAAVLLLAVVRAGLNHWLTIGMTRLVQQQIVVDLRAKVYDKLQRLSFRFFDANASGSIINRVTGDVQNVRAFVDGVLMQTVIMLLSLVLYFAYMLSLHARLTLACLATVPVLWLITTLFSRWVRPEYARNRELYDDMILGYTESLQGVQVTKGFARERERHARFAATNAAVRDQQRRIFWRVSLFSPTVEMLPQLSLVVLMIYGGRLVIDGVLPLGAGLMVFTGLLSQFSAQISGIANITNTAQQSLVGARRVFEVLDQKLEVESPKDAVRPERIRGAVTFQRVHFQYSPADPIVEDVDFHVEPGQCVAILGPTGSGKSTLMSLIPRFYDPTKGRVLIDGTDARRLDLDTLRRSIGLVFQESFLFSHTIAANIAFGDPRATLERVERAAKIAQAHDFIAALPNGYQTVLGESGVSLSGGQRQRLAIARAVLLEPAIMLLDDPTAAIDPETEAEILAAMDAAISGRTTFIVAHRLSTLRRADLILVLDRGRIVERGTHEQLLRAGGHYFRAAQYQLLDDETRKLLKQAEGA
jgi:ATP-binding cassette subfamily B protein